MKTFEITTRHDGKIKQQADTIHDGLTATITAGLDVIAIRECVEREQVWLPSVLERPAVDLVSDVSAAIGYDCDAAAAFCVALLKDVNAHDEAHAVNDLLNEF